MPFATLLFAASNHSKVAPAIFELAVKVIGAPSQTGLSIVAPAVTSSDTVSTKLPTALTQPEAVVSVISKL